MTAVLDQMKDVAYTSVGVNLLVTDAVVDNVRKNRTDFLGRLGETGERVEKFLDDNQLDAPEFLDEYTTKARKVATESLTDLRARMAPRTDELVERLPERMGEALNTSRGQVWDFLGIKAPKLAPAPKAATTTKAKTATKAKTTAKPRTAKRATKAKTTK